MRVLSVCAYFKEMQTSNVPIKNLKDNTRTCLAAHSVDVVANDDCYCASE